MKSHPCAFFPVFWDFISYTAFHPEYVGACGCNAVCACNSAAEASRTSAWCTELFLLVNEVTELEVGRRRRHLPLLGMSSQLLGPAQHSQGSHAAPDSHNAIAHCSFELDRTGGPVAFSLRDL